MSRLASPAADPAACALAGPARAEPVAHVRIDRSDVVYAVNADQTYTETVTIDRTLLTARGIQSRDRSAITYYPDQQTLEVLEAWVDQPDGTRLPVGPESRFTRPSAASQDAPGFTGSLTTTIVYPQLRPGSRTHVKFRRVQTTPPLLGFNAWSEAELEDPTAGGPDGDRPARRRWRCAGQAAARCTVTDTTAGGRRRIVAEMPPSPGQDARAQHRRHQRLPADLPGHHAARPGSGRRDLLPPEPGPRGRSRPRSPRWRRKIAGDRTGLEAARAIYDWVTVNIRYIAVYLNPDDGWVPHAAAEVLKNGYGDCKDHMVLMQALLAARGIVGEAAIIQWGNRFADLPLGHPFEFNHAIVYLPDYDIYLNPTNPYAPFDSLDRTLSGKRVVIATGAGRVARTPASTPVELPLRHRQPRHDRRRGQHRRRRATGPCRPTWTRLSAPPSPTPARRAT